MVTRTGRGSVPVDEGRREAVDWRALVVADGRVHSYIRTEVSAQAMVIRTQASPTVHFNIACFLAYRKRLTAVC